MLPRYVTLTDLPKQEKRENIWALKDAVSLDFSMQAMMEHYQKVLTGMKVLHLIGSGLFGLNGLS